MKLGYVPSFYEDIEKEVAFCKKYFSYIEITLPLETTEKYIENFKKLIGDFPVMGHLHWEYNITKELAEIKKALRNYKKIGASTVTFHPSYMENLDKEQAIEENKEAIRKIVQFADEEDISICIENNKKPPFNTDNKIFFETVFRENPGLKLTFDIGHVGKTNDKLQEIKELLSSMPIDHIHLHANNGKTDHLPLENIKNNILKQLIDSLNNKTVSLEVFEKNEDERFAGSERFSVIEKQIKILKGNFKD